MLKWIFWILLVTNGVLFALHQGYLGETSSERREAGRMAIQLHTERIKLLSESSARSSVSPLFNSPAPEAAAPADVDKNANAETGAAKSEAAMTTTADAHPYAAACIEIGSFSAADAQRFEAQLAALGLKAKSSVRTLAGETSGYMVYVPASADKNTPQDILAELRQLGITDFFALPQSSALRGGVSLGIFKTEEGAQTQLANLTKKGVRNVRIQPRGAALAGGQQLFQLRGLARTEQRAFDRLRAEFPDQKTQACDASTAGGH